ncbi:MAG: L-serine ammonia-lyase, iron-sulfur-dependent, subunit alpha [Candidatus Diapherotrites archaeon]|nr:L-serine ammonia-lyase, iron-sulfur-dependent, subunit alpha [Candidatus Diapherotrites archaeon]
MTEILTQAVAQNRPIYELTLEYEVENHKKSEKEIVAEIKNRLNVMRDAARQGVLQPVVTKSGMVSGNAHKFFNFPKSRKILGPVLDKAIAYSLAVAEVNAAMGVIVAAPTAGSCGIMPGVLFALNEEVDSDEQKLVNGFLTASGVGLFIAHKATFAAAVAGCAAEIGASASMAAATITEFLGGSPKQAINASSISLKSTLGLACDPVAGLVEVPCIKRNAIGVANAFTASQMALAGVESAIPFEEVVVAMYRIGQRLPSELRETSKGGLARTQTGIQITERLRKISAEKTN